MEFIVTDLLHNFKILRCAILHMGNKTLVWLAVGAAASGLAVYLATRRKGKQRLRQIKERPREQKLEELAIA